jgi:predicted Na+-dependent transporter
MIRLIRSNFGIILLISAFLGLLIPNPGRIAPGIILVLLFIIIFSSFFQFDIRWETYRKDILKAIAFVFLRYVFLPVIIYYIINPFSSFLAFSFYFLALIPAGTSSPVIGQMLGGNFNLSILILVTSNFLITITIPLMAPLVSRNILSIDAWGLFRTLFFTIVLPFFIHLPFRKSRRFVVFTIQNLPVIVIICLGLIFCIIIARNKLVVLNELENAIPYLTMALFFLIFLGLSGWLIFKRFSVPEQISASVASGLNNIGLAVSLSTLYLSSQITVLFIYGEFAWVLALIVLKRIIPIIARKI